MLNSMGRLVLEIITLVSLSAWVIAYSPGLFLVLVLCVVPAFAGKATSRSGLRAGSQSDADPPRTGLPAHPRNQQRERQRGQMFRLGGFLQTVSRAHRWNHPAKHPLDAQAAVVGFGISGCGFDWLLRRLRLFGLAHIPG